MSNGVKCMIMRGGTSKGAYFLAQDLPTDTTTRDDLILRIVGSPDPRQIDGIGGAHPLTTKVAIVGQSTSDKADVEYLFLQPSVDEAIVSSQQNCGNLLAGVAAFAIERELIHPTGSEVSVRIHMLNTDSIATATIPLVDGMPTYEGDQDISGVPGTAAAVHLEFADIAGSVCGSLLPTGNFSDRIAGVECTLIDNGMPAVVMRSSDMGITGYETCAELEANDELVKKLEDIRLEAGKLMGLGDVTTNTIPKMTMVAPPQNGGSLTTRTFIPHRCHAAIGVLGAVSVATAALLPGTPGASVLGSTVGDSVVLEHPTGSFEATASVMINGDSMPVAQGSGVMRTARKLMDGIAFPRPESSQSPTTVSNE